MSSVAPSIVEMNNAAYMTAIANQRERIASLEDVRELSKWLNEETSAPINRQALARVLAVAQQPSGGEVVAYKVNWPGVDSVGMRRFYGADEWEASRGTVEFFGGVAIPLTLATPKPEPMTDDEMWAL